MSTVRLRRLLIVAMIGAGIAADAGRAGDGGESPRERLFRAGTEAVRIPLSKRVTVIFVPRLESCTPQEFDIVGALGRLKKEELDLEIVTLIPETASASVINGGIFGSPLPGRLTRVPSSQWVREGRVAPRPRIEVWSKEGQLLLMKSVPPSASESSIHHEILWTLAFTSAPEVDP